uniref:Acetyl-coenzyme A carboxylase carboxyl transferase subunit beta, chloroplastic n=1 Tax=Cynanchum wallichii TaxID=1740896 RepID=A0AA49ENG7_9GENT|nr:acetyl-CoA carboxylase beta subunit [Cynanchum wallichii]WEH01571.1 acetyl-CoA carboxylase beta subunit [Cynanchum wallichii]
MERWRFNSMLFKKELARRCGLNKSMDSLGPIENTGEIEDSNRKDTTQNIQSWGGREDSSYSNVDRLFGVKDIRNFVPTPAFWVKDRNGDSYFIYFDSENQIFEIDNNRLFPGELESSFWDSSYLHNKSTSEDTCSTNDTQSSWNNHINRCIESYLQSQISIATSMVSDIENCTDSYIYRYICGESRNNDETEGSAGIRTHAQDSDLTLEESSNDIDAQDSDLTLEDSFNDREDSFNDIEDSDSDSEYSFSEEDFNDREDSDSDSEYSFSEEDFNDREDSDSDSEYSFSEEEFNDREDSDSEEDFNDREDSFSEYSFSEDSFNDIEDSFSDSEYSFSEDSFNDIEDSFNDIEAQDSELILEDSFNDREDSFNDIEDSFNDIEDSSNDIEDSSNDREDSFNDIEDSSNDIEDSFNEDSSNDIEDSSNDIEDSFNEDSSNDIEDSSNDIEDSFNEDSSNDIEDSFNEDSSNDIEDSFNEDSSNDREDSFNEDSSNDREDSFNEDSSNDREDSFNEDSSNDNGETDEYSKYRHLWVQCDNCYGINYKKYFMSKLYICEHCEWHLKMNSSDRLDLSIDPDTWDPMDEDMMSLDPIEFHAEDEPPYKDRLDSYQTTTGLSEAIQTGIGELNGIPVAVGVMDFEFIGGSMGSVVGEKITRLIEYATNQLLPLIIVCASGGARMQEGSVSLIQMAKISSVLYDYQSNKKLFYVSILASPTTGGVTASFGMLGDIVIAEPNAYIAFAGKRVIEETLKIIVPEGVQETEYLFEKGSFDLIVPRNFLKSVLTELLKLHAFFPLTKN